MTNYFVSLEGRMVGKPTRGRRKKVKEAGFV